MRLNRLRQSRHRGRIILLQGVVVLVLLGVIVRIRYIQSVFGPMLESDAAKVQQVTQNVLAPRGEILDRNGHPLAYDVPAYMFDIRTGSFSNIVSLSGHLAPILQSSESQVLAVLRRSNHWVQWPMPILATQKDKIVQLAGTTHAQDITFTPTEERIYPDGNLASNTIGYVDHGSVGQAGLEEQYNTQLAGHNGKITYTQDVWGFPIQDTLHTLVAAQPGLNVQTTLDRTIQGFVENQMNQLAQKYQPVHAAIIVTNPQTGAVLGMSSYPNFNPNQYWLASETALSTNWAVNARFEPGSTFKVLTLAAALASQKISLSQTFDSSKFQIDGQTILNWNYVGWGQISFRRAMEYSSNVGFAIMAEKLGWPTLLHYMNIFGFLQPTGIGLPGEANSLIFPPSLQGPVQLATSGFGQGIAVTPLQQMQATAAIANGGKLIQPRIVRALINPTTGKVVESFPPKIINPQVVPPEVASEVSNTMALDVSKGIDTAGAVPGYTVAGKTGTAQVVNPQTGQYYAHRYIVSFIGYAPVQNPQFEVYVTVYWPKTAAGQQWGSTVSAPAASNILRECLEYAHIPPDQTSVSSTQSTSRPAGVKYVDTPSLRGLSVAQVKGSLKQLGLTGVDIAQAQGTVQRQWPSPGVQVPVGSKMFFWAPGGSGKSLLMPNLTGVAMRDVANMLATLGLQFSGSGEGYATSQSIPAGQQVRPGMLVKVQFKAP
ncbi:PASTA domain-containing protein [Alicyclobacillaceae bacterium I2511]|nr:PASTA domain-containing protein [Alicyclobacillaceae bacterium I2511]